MYEVIKNVIQNGAYILSDMLVKIDTSWIRGYITEEEKSELIRLARDNADYTMELNTVQKSKELESRVKALEEKDTTTNPEDYSEYVSGKWYYKDDKITFNGKQYVCVAPDGQVCTWNPDEYPTYWNEVSA